MGVDAACFANCQLKYYQKAVQLHSPLNVKLKQVINILILKKL